MAEYFRIEFEHFKRPFALIAEGLQTGDAPDMPNTKTFELHRIVADKAAYASFMAKFAEVRAENYKEAWLRVLPRAADKPAFFLYAARLNSVGLQVECGDIRIAEHVHGLFLEKRP